MWPPFFWLFTADKSPGDAAANWCLGQPKKVLKQPYPLRLKVRYSAIRWQNGILDQISAPPIETHQDVGKVVGWPDDPRDYIFPNDSAHERLIKRALEASGIKPNDVDYIEAHGSGTALGDPIEVEALAEVFAE